MTKSNTNRPTHHLYIVDGEGDEANWAQIAPAWQHKAGDGMNIVLPPGVLVSGKLVIRAAKTEASDSKKA